MPRERVDEKTLAEMRAAAEGVTSNSPWVAKGPDGVFTESGFGIVVDDQMSSFDRRHIVAWQPRRALDLLADRDDLAADIEKWVESHGRLRVRNEELDREYLEQRARAEKAEARLAALEAKSSEPQHHDPGTLLREGGPWLGAARRWLQWNTRNGEFVTWGSDAAIEPPLTARKVEELAAHVAAAERTAAGIEAGALREARDRALRADIEAGQAKERLAESARRAEKAEAERDRREPTREEAEAHANGADETFVGGRTARRCRVCRRWAFGGPTACLACVRAEEERARAEKTEAQLQDTERRAACLAREHEAYAAERLAPVLAERDAATARAEKAEAERDALRARLEARVGFSKLEAELGNACAAERDALAAKLARAAAVLRRDVACTAQHERGPCRVRHRDRSRWCAVCRFLDEAEVTHG